MKVGLLVPNHSGEPSTLCPDVPKFWEESQMLMVSVIIFSFSSGYFFKFLIYLALFIDLILRSSLTACDKSSTSVSKNN